MYHTNGTFFSIIFNCVFFLNAFGEPTVFCMYCTVCSHCTVPYVLFCTIHCTVHHAIRYVLFHCLFIFLFLFCCECKVYCTSCCMVQSFPLNKFCLLHVCGTGTITHFILNSMFFVLALFIVDVI